MLKVSRPASGILVISQGRTQTLVRLAIWIGVVVIFYLVVLGDAALTDDHSANTEATAWRTWVLLLFPLCLLPYLFSLVRALRRADALICDGRAKRLSKRRQTLVDFADIRELELQTVQGTCEEFRLSAILSNGHSIELLEAEASAATEALAVEISELLEAPLIRMI